jgi:hypothetical protein
MVEGSDLHEVRPGGRDQVDFCDCVHFSATRRYQITRSVKDIARIIELIWFVWSVLSIRFAIRN